MRIRSLQLTDYRNFERLSLELPAGASVFVGDNAQGKSNLLEAVYLLATMRSLRAETDAQLIRTDTLSEVLPAARVVAEVETGGEPLRLEVVVTARPGAQGPVGTKTVKVNGVAKRLSDAVGRLAAVLFTADDLDLLTGPPSGRRRFLDLALTQIDPRYAAARQRYERVLQQRNHLLKRIRENEARPDELTFWDGEMCSNGALILQRRAAEVREMASLAAAFNQALAPGDELVVEYEPRLDSPGLDLGAAEVKDVAAAFGEALARGLSRDIAAGMTLQGPHRDDVSFMLNSMSAGGFASRAQQRTIALALRLAEARLLTLRRGEPPVLLLDDILSEMDAGRRRSVMEALGDVEQMLVTGTDWDRFPAEFLESAATFEVREGAVQAPVSGRAFP
jgi:DNA replication and repair protein RecF